MSKKTSKIEEILVDFLKWLDERGFLFEVSEKQKVSAVKNFLRYLGSKRE